MRFIKLLHYFLQIIWAKNFSKSITDVIFAAVSDLGGIYIKLIQFICLRHKLFSETEKIRFLSFYDEVPFELISPQQVIQKELGEKILQFKSIENTPFASGSFGQVYRALLKDGTKVIVKIKRPNLVFKLKVDFVILKEFTQLFNLFYYQKIIDTTKLEIG